MGDRFYINKMNNTLSLLLVLTLINTISSQQCEVQDPLKVDCGYMGIDQNQC